MKFTKQNPCWGVLLVLLFATAAFAEEISLYYPPDWREKAAKAEEIANVLSQATGLKIQPAIAANYPKLMEAFEKDKPVLVYAGSFVQALLYGRKLSTPLTQAIDGKELYRSVLIAPLEAGKDPVAIVKAAGPMIAFTKSASSGETGAKAASGGQAGIEVNNHASAVQAVKVGKAKAAFVKDWWWAANKEKFPEMQQLDYPGVSEVKHPDNILSANSKVSAGDAQKITEAVKVHAAAFGASEIVPFDTRRLQATLDLMQKAQIDLNTYKW